MLEAKLDFCASLLYHWIELHSGTNKTITFNLDNFQTWTGEFLEHKASRDEIQTALFELQNFDLITVEGNEISLRDRISKFQPQIESLPTFPLTRSKNNYPWLGAVILILCFLGLGLGSMLFPANTNQQNRENIENLDNIGH
ncbi:MAG: hypothetical protein QNJ55_04210 [Xenococcus sp. MO_188.B8]|nr:hypothetical protein [Xenococcus sp. MO_188.B8]